MTPRKSLLWSLRTVYETLKVSVPTVIGAVRGTLTPELCDERIETWASRVVAGVEMMISVHGREHVEPGTTYLVMSNHQSHYDVAVIYYVLGSHIRMVAKRELFNVPVFGRAIRAAGFISVDRQNTASAIASLEGAKEKLARGVSIWISPEGTRSPTGDLMPFKKGGFALALATGVPILPVSIRGTREVLRAKGLRTRRGVEVSVTIHAPVAPARFAGMPAAEARKRMMEQVRTAIASGLG